MPLSMQAISIIGRLHPEIFDILGTPTAVVGRYRSRFDQVALNPQPLPPGPPEALVTGVRAAAELVRLAFTAHQLGVAFDADPDDWCGTPPHVPIPWPYPPITQDPDPHPWLVYNLGVALGLELSASVWSGLRSEAALSAVHDGALSYAQKAGEQSRTL
ncbi:MAG: hypothetical protein B7X41_12205 [Microbacterium sp. 14-71-5]|nr:MAG: hypothetical protein B7X41_12205 [Microbacterium sp. 14-71-5]